MPILHWRDELAGASELAVHSIGAFSKNRGADRTWVALGFLQLRLPKNHVTTRSTRDSKEIEADVSFKCSVSSFKFQARSTGDSEEIEAWNRSLGDRKLELVGGFPSVGPP